MSGAVHVVDGPALPLAALLRDFPVALLDAAPSP
jgi:hypothetical protein